MIFVTVGTHEQQFDRLVKQMDMLVKNHVIQEEVVVQTGFCDYEPQYCTWKKMLPYEEMCANAQRARIIITHGGPSSFIMALQLGKIPIVVPRQKQFEEHVNDHQVDFCAQIAHRQGNILLVKDVEDLQHAICNYDEICATMRNADESNNVNFCRKLEKLVSELLD